MSMTIEDFKITFNAYVKDTPDETFEAEVLESLAERFPDLDVQHKPNVKLMADVLHEAALELAKKLPTLIKPLTDEATALNAALPQGPGRPDAAVRFRLAGRDRLCRRGGDRARLAEHHAARRICRNLPGVQGKGAGMV